MKRAQIILSFAMAMLLSWMQLASPYCIYAASTTSENDWVVTEQDTSGQTEWTGDDASASKPDDDAFAVDGDDDAAAGVDGDDAAAGIDEGDDSFVVDDSDSTDTTTDDGSDDTSADADEFDSQLSPNSWRFSNGAMIVSDDDGIDAQSLSDGLPSGAVARGVDVSNWQGTIDWTKVKASGISFAILKVGPVYGKVDAQFQRNASECERLGIPYGVYYYTYARSVSEANTDATRTLTWLAGHKPSLPVYYDVEDDWILKDSSFSRSKLTQIVQTFCNRISASGYTPGIYANLNWFNNYLNDSSLSKYDHWVAQYNSSCSYKGSYSFWQYSSSGSVPGISGSADMNYAYTSAYFDFVDDGKQHVVYRSHVSNLGWLNRVADGTTSGTTGRGLGLEALNVTLYHPEVSGSVQVRAHVSDIGWQGWTSSTAGTTGQSKHIEALQIRLSGNMANKYDIYYRVHAANFGWMKWAKNGESAGTEGYGYNLEAVQIKLVKKGSSAPSESGANVNYAFSKAPIRINYQAHVQDIGWQATVNNGGTAGTTGKSKRIEALNVSLSNSDYAGGVQIRAHVQDIGWQGWSTSGGTTGKGKRVEAIQVRLTGDVANYYDVYYRVHAQDVGWTTWAKNSASAGTEGYGRRLEAIQIRLVKKGGSAPSNSGANVNYAFSKAPISVNYQAHVQNIGWQGAVSNGATAGTSGRSLRVEALNVSLSNSDYAGGVQIRAHVQDIGWQGWSTSGGTTGRSKRVEAIQVRLTGNVANYYDVYYRVHAQDFGWMGWAKNGASAGSEGYAKRLEAIQIKLVKKGGAAPGSTSNTFKKRG